MIPVIFKDKSMCYYCGGRVDIVTVDGRKYPYSAHNALLDNNKTVISHMECNKCGRVFYISWDISRGVPSPIFEFNEDFESFMYGFSHAE